jgi:hypothetical protein
LKALKILIYYSDKIVKRFIAKMSIAVNLFCFLGLMELKVVIEIMLSNGKNTEGVFMFWKRMRKDSVFICWYALKY